MHKRAKHSQDFLRGFLHTPDHIGCVRVWEVITAAHIGSLADARKADDMIDAKPEADATEVSELDESWAHSVRQR